jgi:hypothetical protein
MSSAERLRDSRRPLNSKKRKNNEVAAEATTCKRVSTRRIQQLADQVETCIYEVGAGDDARTGDIWKELNKRPIAAAHPVPTVFTKEQGAAMYAGYAAWKTVTEIRTLNAKMTTSDKQVLQSTCISCSTGKEAEDGVLARQAEFFGYSGTNGRIKFRNNFVKPNDCNTSVVTRRTRSHKIDGNVYAGYAARKTGTEIRTLNAGTLSHYCFGAWSVPGCMHIRQWSCYCKPCSRREWEECTSKEVVRSEKHKPKASKVAALERRYKIGWAEYWMKLKDDTEARQLREVSSQRRVNFANALGVGDVVGVYCGGGGAGGDVDYTYFWLAKFKPRAEQMPVSEI